MSLASKVGTLIGTGTAYVVHYTKKGATPLGVVSIVYAHRKDIQTFAVQNNLLECLKYIH